MRNIVTLVAVAGLLALMGCSSQPAKVEGAKSQTAKEQAKPQPAKTEVAPAAKVVIRVNAGAAKEYVDGNGHKWAADQEYSKDAKFGAIGGKTAQRTGLTITGTKCPDIYTTERYSMDAYRFDVPNGTYTVRLHFAETYERITEAGERIFYVRINGKTILESFDVFKVAGGFAKPAVEEFKDITVADGKILVEFTPEKQNPEINGLEVMSE